MTPDPASGRSMSALITRAWSALSGMRIDEGLSALGAIESLLRGGGFEAPPSLMLEIELLRAASAALNDDAESALELVEQALVRHECAADHPAASILLRLGHWKARRIDTFCDMAHSPHQKPTRRRDALWAMHHLSMEAAFEFEQLRLVSAQRLAIETLDLSERVFGPGFSGSRLAAALNARILYEQSDFSGVDQLIHDRLVLSGSQGGIEGALVAYIVGARVAAARQQTPFAVLLLREAETIGEERGWARLVAASLAERVRLFVADGQLKEAESCARRLAQAAANSTIASNAQFLSLQLAISDAHLALAEGPSTHAVATLRTLLSASLSRRERFLAVELTLLLACILHRLGQRDEASIEVMRAIELGAAAGLYQTFLDGGEPIRQLLAWMYDRRTADGGILAELRPYVRALLIGLSGRARPAEGDRNRHKSGESLSPRERHIVSLMSHGLSNKRIAKQLGIAPETVKSHAKHILQKLAAQTRVEAVSRSLSLGII